MRLFISSFCLLLLIVSYSNKPQYDELAGIWKPIKKEISPDAIPITHSIKSIEIRRVGQNEINYFVFIDHVPLAFKRRGNDLIHKIVGDSITIHFDPIKKTIKIDRRNVAGIPDDPTLTKTSSFDSSLASAETENVFFDYNILKHQSGVPENVAPHLNWLIFKINPAFIKKKKITSLKIPIFRTISDTSQSKLKYIAEFEFDEAGNTTQIENSLDEKYKRNWKFIYRADQEQSLEKIIFNPSTSVNQFSYFNYDKDSWLVDDFNQKVITSRVEWTMNQNNLPARLVLKYAYEAFTEFSYDHPNNLTRVLYVFGKSRTMYYFTYTSSGILKKVNIVENA